MLQFLLDEHISPTVCSIVRERRSRVLIESLLEWRDAGLRGKDDHIVLAAAAEAGSPLSPTICARSRHSYRFGPQRGLAIKASFSLMSALADHSSIIRYCKRPFAGTAELNETILARINESVKADDELYFLGDFCIGGPKVAAAYRQKIRCKKVYFILGNHDRVIRKIVDQFVWVKEIAEINIRNQPIVLCHYAMRVWHHSGRGASQLYGHSHGKLPAGEGSRSMDVGVDTNGFRPYSLDEIRAELPAQSIDRYRFDLDGA